MRVSSHMGINEKGHLTFGGLDTVSLARQYGTPVYLMNEDLIRENCQTFRRSIQEYYDGNGLVCYASKAFSCKAIYRIMQEEQCGADAVSIGEIYTALSAGFPAGKIVFHGNNKTAEALRYALNSDVGRIVVDNFTELSLLNDLAGAMGKRPRVLLRIKPGIDAHTHAFIRTGQIDSKFGFALETGEALMAAVAAAKMQYLDFCGVHCHIGSQIFEIEPFELAAEVMMEFIFHVKEQTGLALRELNLGGGFGISYTEEDQPKPLGSYLQHVCAVVKRQAQAYQLPMPMILIEPGRSIVGPAGMTLYTVGARKEIPDVRTYVSIDGGMCDNPRYALYQSRYEIVAANKASLPKDDVITLAGECCESGDLIGEHMPLSLIHI